MSDRPQDLSQLARDPGPDPARRVSAMAAGLVGSQILKIAGEIRALLAAGKRICNFTVGDFAPRLFPIPDALGAAVRQAYQDGETNYPPPDGMPELREAIRSFYLRELGLDYPAASVLVASGARPVIYALYRTLCDPGDRIVYSLPGWNNESYVHLVGGQGVPIHCSPEQRFLPTRAALAPVLPGARLLCLNSPLNPAGTAFAREVLAAIGEAVLTENRSRERTGERPLYLMYDQVYWTLCFGDSIHVTPPGLLPELARFTLLVDGISKTFAATGLRVGWAVGPADVIARMSALVGHMGAWAPRPEQVACAALLRNERAIHDFQDRYRPAVQSRLDRLHRGLTAIAASGQPVQSLPPAGAIYLTARIHPFGRRAPEGQALATNEDVRRYLLEAAGVAVIPFQAFGTEGDTGWFRFSVGAVAEAEIDAAIERLAAALAALDPAR